MGTPTDDFYSAPSGQQINFGKLVASTTLTFTDGVAEDKDLNTLLPGYGAIRSPNPMQPGMSILPLSKIWRYDGTPGSVTQTVTLLDNPAMPEFTIVNANASSVPACIGLVFPKGAVDTPHLSVNGEGVEIRRRWNDGSIAHARVCGTLPTNQLLRVSDQKAAGNLMTESNVASANPFAEVDLDIGFISLQDMIAQGSAGLGDLFTLYSQTEDMVECHYRARIGTTQVEVEFHVRVFASGDVWVGYMLEDPRMIRGTSNDTNGTAVNGTITLGTSTRTLTDHRVYRNGVNWDEAWTTGTSYSFDVQHNVNQVINTHRVPAMGMASSISESRLNNNYQDYQWGQRGNWTADMGATGFQDMIGHLPRWECDWLVSGDIRAYKSILANAKAYGNYPSIWRSADHEIFAPPDNADGSYVSNGSGTTGMANKATSSFRWEKAHVGFAGYLAYLLTGDALYQDLMVGHVMTYYQAENKSMGLGVNRIVSKTFGQQRTLSWFWRSLSAMCGILPDNHPKLGDYKQWMINHSEDAIAQSTENATAAPSKLGIPVVYGTGETTNGDANVRAWMAAWWPASVGLATEYDPVGDGDLVRMIELRDWMYNFPINLFGPHGEYSFTYAGVNNFTPYNGTISGSRPVAASQCRQTWGPIFDQSHPTPTINNRLQGPDGTILANPDNASTNWWGNMLPGLQMARFHNKSGASAAWSRLSGADNYGSFASSFQSSPTSFGFTPWAVLTEAELTANIVVEDTPVPGTDYDLVRDEWTPSYDGNGNILPNSVDQIPLSTPSNMRWGKVLNTAMRGLQTEIEQALGKPYSQIDQGTGSLHSTLNAYSGMALAVDEGKIYSVSAGGHNDSSLNCLYHLNIEKLGSSDSWGMDIAPEDPVNWSVEYRTNNPSIGFSRYRPTSAVAWPLDITEGDFPTSTHTYGWAWWDSKRKLACRNRESFWRGDPVAKTWRRDPNNVQEGTPVSGYIYGMLYYNEVHDEAYGFAPQLEVGNFRYNWVTIDPDSGEWVYSTVQAGQDSTRGWSGCEMHNGNLAFCGPTEDGRDRLFTYDKTTRQRTLYDIPAGSPSLNLSFQNEGSGLVYIPEWDQFLRRISGSGYNGKWYRRDYKQNLQPEVTSEMQGNVPPWQAYVWNKMFYYPPHNCVYYISTNNVDADSVYVMRTG